MQVPTLYRLFTDMNELLEEVAADGFARYLAHKHSQTLTEDPVDDLRRGWDTHLAFGLENPAHYLLMYGRRSAPAERALQRLRCSSNASRSQAGSPSAWKPPWAWWRLPASASRCTSSDTTRGPRSHRRRPAARRHHRSDHHDRHEQPLGR